jgi:hypothetical protein
MRWSRIVIIRNVDMESLVNIRTFMRHTIDQVKNG